MNGVTEAEVRLLEAIAREKLGIPTLEPRMADHLDFHEVGVWSLREALLAAYRAGAASVGPRGPAGPTGGKGPPTP